ncbi:MAG: hypothetical protein QXU54_01245 [Candidatus Micrarchaeia archaeon]
MVLIMAAQVQKDKKLEELTTSITRITREANGLFALGQTVERYENQTPKKTTALLKEESFLRNMNTQALQWEANVCERLLGCIERWNK